mmetsp:Transcript_36883/g.82024  ORF Transcript_36883/g.82024 Transcript_36883/m.82024 type:complete len:168 (+) Transcript_36883:78-581(+)
MGKAGVEKKRKAEQPGAEKNPKKLLQEHTSSKASKPKIDKHNAAAPASKPDKEVNKKKKASEIDDIFNMGTKTTDAAQDDAAGVDAGAFKDISERIKKARQEKKPEKAPTEKKAKIEGSKDDIFGQETGRNRKKTEEGYAIYSEEELGLNKRGGDTPLCPFDCDCCY